MQAAEFRIVGDDVEGRQQTIGVGARFVQTEMGQAVEKDVLKSVFGRFGQLYRLGLFMLLHGAGQYVFD